MKIGQFDRQNIQNNPEKAPAQRQAGNIWVLDVLSAIASKTRELYNTRALEMLARSMKNTSSYRLWIYYIASS
ncbi:MULTISPECIES: hypothetical protein [Microcoleaceae]|uniref:hypothetical protein n=1 Tax=Microcoleaceae TaxID=1892252 RepID=UPI0018819419|nr:hypothetical protein [Tychonema sp. LEGE 06208]MBE9164598.1 hypothetical protein [Tychonema sp. LEGE 06208]